MISGISRGQTIAVTLGGTSSERSISLLSGENVALALEQAGAKVLRVDTSEEGWAGQLKQATFVFNLLHGPGGEDGRLQSVFEFMGMPYSGSGVLGSALAMDKIRAKQVWLGAGLPTPSFSVLNVMSNWHQIINCYSEVFVKPAYEGSSLGMTYVSSEKQLQGAFEVARKFGSEVLAEQYINGKEYTVAILGDATLPSIRIETSQGFYDYDAKYRSQSTLFHCPSGLNLKEESELSELALEAFRVIGGEVWGRVDLIRDLSGAWQILEVNTIPGMTSHSLVPMAAEAAGINMLDLLTRIYQLSLELPRGFA